MNPTMSDREQRERVLGIHGPEGVEEDWSREIAERRARERGIELNDGHWEVIRFLRQYYTAYGPVTHARELTRALDSRFSDQGGSRYLYRLFPNGPVVEGCHIAGLAPPADSRNSSFGSVM